MTGTRGPLPKPAALKLLEGNGGKRALDLSAGVNPRIEIPAPPRSLGKAAAKEWKRITPLLLELGLISGLDRAALSMYCQAQGRLEEIEQAFEGKVKALMKSDDLDYATAVYRASYMTTPNGYEQQSVIIQLLSRHREQVHKYLMHFGLSPAARGRVQPSNYIDLQHPLPGMEGKPQPQSGFARFGLVPKE